MIGLLTVYVTYFIFMVLLYQFHYVRLSVKYSLIHNKQQGTADFLSHFDTEGGAELSIISTIRMSRCMHTFQAGQPELHGFAEQ